MKEGYLFIWLFFPQTRGKRERKSIVFIPFIHIPMIFHEMFILANTKINLNSFKNADLRQQKYTSFSL
jgi:hypothetical protein